MKTIKRCKNCNNKFFIIHCRKYLVQFCSKQCREKYTISKKININCKYCNKELLVFPSQKNKNFCSQKCYHLSKRQRPDNCYYEYCIDCGKKFTSHRDRERCRECYLVYSKKENHPSWDGGDVEVSCCQCNKTYKVPKCRIETSKYCSKKCQGRYNSIHKRGSNHPHWKGDKAINKKYRDRTSIEYTTWRKEVFDRDDYTCQECDKRGGYLEAHHILKFSDYPELRFEISNGITLCCDCHNKTKHHEQDYQQLFQEIVENKSCVGV